MMWSLCAMKVQAPLADHWASQIQETPYLPIPLVQIIAPVNGRSTSTLGGAPGPAGNGTLVEAIEPSTLDEPATERTRTCTMPAGGGLERSVNENVALIVMGSEGSVCASV